MLCPKTVLITGSNRGIGLELVKQFLKLKPPPTNLFAACRSPENAKDLKELASANPSVVIVKLDTADQTSIDNARSSVEDKLEGSGLNLLINNAAIGSWCSFNDVTVEKMVEHYKVNCVGPLMVTKAFYPALKIAANAGRDKPMSCSRSAVINISTGVASISENSSGGAYPYRASKAALNMITSNFALEFKKDGVIATAVHPGWVRTDMGGPNALIGTEESAVGIMNILTKLEGEEGTGKFYHAIRGDTIGW